MTDDIQSALREMARSIGALESQVSGFANQWRDQDQKASFGRRDLHQKIDALRIDVQELDGQVKAAIKDIALMKPTVEAVESAKLQAQGAVTAVRWTSRATYWLAASMTLGVGWVLTNWLNIKVTMR